jgi:hypothetical protein
MARWFRFPAKMLEGSKQLKSRIVSKSLLGIDACKQHALESGCGFERELLGIYTGQFV